MPTVSAKISVEEMAVWKEKAEAAGQTVAAYVRSVVNQVASGSIPEPSQAIQEARQQVAKAKSAQKPTTGLCDFCARRGKPSCPTCYAAWQKTAPSATDTFSHLLS